MGSILGNRVARVEDPRFLTGAAPTSRTSRCPARRGSPTCARRSPTPASPASTRSEALGGAWGARRVHRRDLAELGLAPHLQPDLPRGDAPPLRGAPASCGSWASRWWPSSPRTGPSATDAADLVLVDYDPLPVVVDPEAAAARRGAALPRRRHQRRAALRRRRPQADFSGCEVVVERAHRQPAHDGGADRAPLGRGLLDRRRPPRPLLGLPGRAPDPRPARRGLRPRAGAGPGDRARRRRRLRRQVAHAIPRSWPSASTPGAVGPAGALDRDPLGEHGRHAPRAGARCQHARHRRHPRRAASPPTSSTWCRTPAPTR